jgi:1-acyl-sn-glycerol-3-phosphate acyltransferase
MTSIGVRASDGALAGPRQVGVPNRSHRPNGPFVGNLLLYPEGTRSRGGGPGRVRRGAAVLAAAHNLSIIPIRVTGTAEAMPPGRLWPRRLHGKLLSKRHRITVAFGEPIPPNGDTAALIERVQSFFENGDGGPSRSPYRRQAPKAEKLEPTHPPAG